MKSSSSSGGSSGGSSSSGSSSSSSSSSHSKKIKCEDLDLSDSEQKECSDTAGENINLLQSPSVDKFSLLENRTHFMIRWSNDTYTGSVAMSKLPNESNDGTNVHKGIVPASGTK
jgi:hypothetical protein